MATSALKSATRTRKSTSVTQGTILPGQVKNSDGAAVFAVDDFTRLRRFLVLGSEGGSYYASERKLTKQNLTAVERALKADGLRFVNTVVEVSEAGRAPKNDYALFALAMASASENDAVRRAALDAIPRVARTGTHLFQFAEFVQSFRGWGRGLRRAVARWYEREGADGIAYQAIKYRQREGWTHRDLLRLSHPQGVTPQHKALYEWIVRGNVSESVPSYVEGLIKAQSATSDKEVAALIREYGLPREAIPTEMLTSKEVWNALLEKMPATALIRNLGTMTSNGILTGTSKGTSLVLDKLADGEWLTKSRVHPLSVLVALKTYESGGGYRSSKTWTAVGSIKDALNEAFYASFGNIQPTNKRWMLAIDVSSSMAWSEVAGMPGITPAVGAAAMAMVTARSEKLYEVRGFADGLRDLGITPRQSLNTVLRKTQSMNFGSTDCALPMEWAVKSRQEFDVCVRK